MSPILSTLSTFKKRGLNDSLIKRNNVEVNNNCKECRVIGVVDADAFEVQVNQLLHPEYAHTKGFPTIVAQESGRIVSRSHEAKTVGISRSLKVHQAKRLWPDLHIIMAKKKFGKHDNTHQLYFSNKFREVALAFRAEHLQAADCDESTLDAMDIPIERTGCDEFLIDLTHLVTDLINRGCAFKEFDPTHRNFMEGRRYCYKGNGLQNRSDFYYARREHRNYEEVRLACGLQIMDELCQRILKDTKIVCSGGVGSNKVMAKLACNIWKPNAVTALTRRGFYRISHRVPFRDVSGFGGSLGAQLHTFFGDLNLKKLRNNFLKNWQQLQGRMDLEDLQKTQRLIFAVCFDPVESKLMNKGLNCGKNNLNIRSEPEFRTELNLRVQNMVARMQEDQEWNKRVATGVKLQYRYTTLSHNNTGYQRNFPMDMTKVAYVQDNEGKFGRSAKSFFDQAIVVAVTENPDFKHDCSRTIDGINFSLTKEVKFGDVE